MIDIDDFISFLEEFRYKSSFIEHVKSNKKNYKNISHEITIVFNKNTLLPYRSGFYGCF